MHFFTIDVEDWFNILDTPAAPSLECWGELASRLERNMERLLEVLASHDVTATLFWLGWFAERYPDLLRRCVAAGHEIACHGYGHVLAYQVGREAFREDIHHGKTVIEDIAGTEVYGFRAAGFSATKDLPWFFEELAAAGFHYDSSVFPASRGHGGIAHASMLPHWVKTSAENILEFPQSMWAICGKRLSVFGGGYLRLAPWWLIRAGVRRLEAQGQSVVFYVHPREVDPKHPRLPLSMKRYFKCYVNLETTMGKLQHICAEYKFQTMQQAWEIMKDRS